MLFVSPQIGQFTWYYLFTADLSTPYSLKAKELPPSHSTYPATSLPFPTIAFQYTLDGNITNVTDFGPNGSIGPDTSLYISQCSKATFQYWVIPPYFPFGYTLMGELNKIVPVSEQRFSDITISENIVKIRVRGVPAEKVNVTLYDRAMHKQQVVNCIISESGYNWLIVGGELLCYAA